MENLAEIRERLVRAEQDIKNHRENFASFKQEDFGALKKEVHAMRGELNDQLKELRELMLSIKDQANEKTNSINLLLAKWTGGLGVAMFVLQIVLKKIGF